MDKNNVLQFQPKNPTKEEIQEAFARARQVLNAVEQKRKDGQELLEKKVDQLNSINTEEGDTVTHRSVVHALEGALTSITALNAFVDMLRQDLVNAVTNLEGQMMSGYSTSLHLEAVIRTLLDKNVITDTELKQAFIEAQRRLAAEMQQPQETTKPEATE